MTKAAVIQMTSGPTVEANIEALEGLISASAAAGARLVLLPENANTMPLSEKDRYLQADETDQGQMTRFLAAQARHHRITLAAGLSVKSPQAGKIFNSCMVFDPQGKLVANYRKMHLFDIDLNASESYRESAYCLPGCEAMVCQWESELMGLSICYDLRFPELYRDLSGRGAKILLVPAAFTVPTGEAHWEVLLRARAIENQCFVMAAAQWGKHANGRYTYGHSMIIDPWGRVLAEKPAGIGWLVADLDFDSLESVRSKLPSWRHRRMA